MDWKTLLSTTLFIIVIVLFGIISLLIYDTYFSQTQFFNIVDSDDFTIVNYTILDDYPDGVLFYNNLRFPSNKISYSLDSECNEFRADSARGAFSILENNTVLDFTEETEGQILVSCSQLSEVPEGEYFIAGEGGPNSIINASNFYVSHNGTIFLYTDSSCNRPVVAVHEILHVFRI